MSRVKAHPIVLGQYPTTLLLSIFIGDLNVVITGVVSVADSGRDSAKWLEGMQLQVIHCSCSICKVGHSIVTCWVHVTWRMRGLVGEFQSLSICFLVTTRQACVCVFGSTIAPPLRRSPKSTALVTTDEFTILEFTPWPHLPQAIYFYVCPPDR